MFNKIISFITDSRLPIYYPLNYMNWQIYNDALRVSKSENKPEIDILLTFDLEHDYGSMGTGENRYTRPFLEYLKTIKYPSTIFVQGNLVEPYAEHLKHLKHELGLHGYAHEPWGTSWFMKDKLPSVDEREKLLDKSISVFENAGLPKPKSFRAPNMVIDTYTRRLLRNAGFLADSSYPSYKGGEIYPFWNCGLHEIPVSFDIKPHFGKFKVVRYAVFNTSNLVTNEFEGGFLEAAKRIITIQRMQVKRPMLIFMAHPWEFFTPYNEDKNLRYCNPDNQKKLEDALDSLRTIATPRFLTMQESLKSL